MRYSLKRCLFCTVWFIALLIQSCTTPYSPVKIFDEQKFPGLEQGLHSAPNRNLVIIAIHGMCHHDKSWADGTVYNMADFMDMKIQYPSSTSKDPQRLIGPSTHSINAFRANLHRESDQARIALYTILFSTPADKEKETLCPDVSSDNPICQKINGEITYDLKRASLNASLKNNLLNDCLADAVYYLGKNGTVVRDGVGKALDNIYRDIQSDNDLRVAPISYISESLGSKVLTDSLLCSGSDETSTFEKYADTISNSQTIYLMANQIPLLNMGSPTYDCAEQGYTKFTNSSPLEYLNNWGLFADSIKFQVTKKSQASAAAPNETAKDGILNLVVFTDPNDLLSYRVGKKDAGNNVLVTNVAVSNDKTWFNLIENPYPAHTKYLENKDVLNLLRWGNSN